MLELEQLCRYINMPVEVTRKVTALQQELDFSKLREYMDLLKHSSTWTNGLEELKKALSTDTNGFKMLTCMLVTVLEAYEKYLVKGIDERIFYDTMACFSRFVKEHKVGYGVYGFDRDFWTPRQISLDLFRIGELEYELTKKDNQNVISMHIPSDVDLSKEKCRTSYVAAIAFLEKYYPDFHYKNFVCESWLLSPNLQDVLGTDSKILQFQRGFTILDVKPEAKDYMEWVYKNRDLTIDQVPQDTTLQRKMKAYLINGGFIGIAFGILKKDAFE